MEPPNLEKWMAIWNTSGGGPLPKHIKASLRFLFVLRRFLLNTYVYYGHTFTHIPYSFIILLVLYINFIRTRKSGCELLKCSNLPSGAKGHHWQILKFESITKNTAWFSDATFAVKMSVYRGPQIIPALSRPWLIKWSVTTSGTRGDVQYSKALEFDSDNNDCKVGAIPNPSPLSCVGWSFWVCRFSWASCVLYNVK